MTIAILSNVNIDPIKFFLKDKKVYLFGYNQIRHELSNLQSVINSSNVNVLVCFIDFNHLLVGHNINKHEENLILHEFDTLVELIEDYSQRFSDKIVIVNNLIFKEYLVFSFSKEHVAFLNKLVYSMNERLYETSLKLSNFHVLNWRKIVNRFGFDKIYINKYWYIGRIPLTTYGIELLSKEINCLLDAIHGKTKKVCIVDLDNTLWGGVVGDCGVKEIVLGEEGLGKAYRDFQKSILSLKDIGVLLCVVSKNTYDIVSECFQEHPMMVLKLDDFIITKINWKSKVDNIKELAEELNLGLDSFVFIDDNPAEREAVRTYLPEVAVPEFPSDPYELVDWFYNSIVPNYFGKVNLTKEDLSKQKQYKANLQRGKLERESPDYTTFIKSLGIKYTVYINAKNQVPRISQLTQKTNQFNLTTQRLTEADVQSMIDSGKYLFFTLEYTDKFGEEGIIGLSIVKLENCKAFIDNFLLSCRVFNRFLEYALMKHICKKLSEIGISVIYGEYIPTRRNSIVSDFYKKCGFETINENQFIGETAKIIEYIENSYITLEGGLVNG